jgi:diguanylate cyclase (GGDEF)-like protein/PAS domain S-box-containing protein
MTGKPQLLLVNGNREQAGVLARFISANSGYDVVTADTGTAAVTLLKQLQIHCVVSDIYLDGLDGWRLARMVRSGVFNCSDDIPFIIVSSTWCKRIAEKTAREFDIDQLLPFENHPQLKEILAHPIEQQRDARKSRVLAIEDTPETADLVQRILKQRFEVDLAADGVTGLQLWREKKHAIVLLDVMLPGMSGPEVLEHILSEKPDQTVVIMTAHGTMDLAEELVLKGASDFISKPFPANQLRKVCEIAAHREDFMISNQQFAETVSNLEASKEALFNLAQEHKNILDNLTSSVLELDDKGNIVFINDTWRQMTGWSDGESLGRAFTDIVYVDPYSSTLEIRHAISRIASSASERFRLEFKLKDRFGEAIWVEGRFSGVRCEDKASSIFVSVDDISARRRAEQRLEHMAMHDTLTGLHNRYFFDNELGRITVLAKHSRLQHALLYIDLNHFKAINDTQGHQQGDAVLCRVAEQMLSHVQDTGSLFRIGGDEFALLLADTDITAAEHEARTICQLLESERYGEEGQVFKVSCCIGICMIDGSQDTPQDYQQRADIALYVAKHHGPGGVHTHTDEDQESDDVRVSMHWLHTVRDAIEQDNIVLHLQPIYHIPTSSVAYYEALVRLEIEDRLVYPGEFIQALERFHEMSLLDQHVVAKAIKMLADHPRLKQLAINLSAQAFHNEKLVPLIEAKLTEYDVNPGRVIFELTESASLTNLGATQTMVKRLAEMGCSFSIDDFGTGFSTFSYLKSLPADTVKIDGSFVKELKNSEIDRALVRSIRDVAWTLGKMTVAEFVEDRETLDLLREFKVEYAQGYYLGKPAPIEALDI